MNFREAIGTFCGGVLRFCYAIWFSPGVQKMCTRSGSEPVDPTYALYAEEDAGRKRKR